MPFPYLQKYARNGENSIVFESNETCVEKFVHKETNEEVVIKYHRTEYPKQHVLDSYERDFNVNKHLFRSPTSSRYIVQGLELLKLDGGRIAYVMKDDHALSLERYKTVYRHDILEFLRIAIEMAKAFSNMHEQNVIHLDIKPQNILITPNKEVKLMDFGVSQLVSMKQPTVPFTGNPVGTYAYMSPEATGRFSRHIDSCADIYSTGMTLYKMLHGEPAFLGQNIELVHAHIAKNPTLLHELHPEIPLQISEIIQKCLEKNPENRFSSMAALSRALQYCYDCIVEDRPLDTFNLNDFVDIGVFSIPDKLYGREQELENLENLLIQTCNDIPKIAMVGGYSGCGKTALVGELNRRLVGRGFRAIFASGKFNQFQNQPYDAIIQIMEQLVRQLSLMGTDEMEAMKEEIIRQTEGNASLLMKVIPSLENVIGEQPEVEQLSRASDSEERFAKTIIGFLKAFGRSEEYLLLFIDDLQWSDPSSLSIIDGLVRTHGSKIFAVGAYRSNEVDDAHPLIQTINTIEGDNYNIEKINLGSLSLSDVNNLISDTLGIDATTSLSLSEEIYTKTQGNAFFTREFFLNLYAEKFVRYSLEENKWVWSSDDIRMQNFSANVVDFMVKNITKFDASVQNLLSIASCIGSTFKIADLATALDMTIDEVNELAYPPIMEGWLQVKADSMKWQHDRLQEASAKLMSKESLYNTHLVLGRRIWENATSSDNIERHLFDIVGHFCFIDDISVFEEEEKLKLIFLYLQAGEAAIESSAFAPALQYSKKAVELLGESPFEKNFDVAFQIHLLLAKAHYVNSNYEESEAAFKNILDNSEEKLYKLRVLLALNEMYYVTSQFEKSYLLMMEMYKISKLFQDVPREDPGEILAYVQTSYAECLRLLEERGEGNPISKLPLENDEEVYLSAAISSSCTASVFLAANAQPLHLFSMALVNLIGLLKYGKNKFSVTVLGLCSWVFNLFFKNVKIGYEFLEQADILLNEFKNDTSTGRLTLFKAQVTQYHPDPQYSSKMGRELCDRAFVILNAVGDYSFAGFAAQHGTTRHFRFLTNIKKQLERHQRCVAFYRKTKWVNTEDLDSSTVNVLRVLAGLEQEYNPKYIQEGFTEKRLSRMHHHYYHAWTLYFQRRYPEALEAATRSQAFLEDAFGLVQFNDFFLLMSLILAKVYEIAPEEKKEEIMTGLKGCKGKIDEFDEVYTSFFKAYKALIEAEILRITVPENIVAIANAYDEAIVYGDELGIFLVTGLANELCGEYLTRKEFENPRFASFYLQSALGIWESIGANLKSKQLLELYPKYTLRQQGNKTTVPSSTTHTKDRTQGSERSATTNESNDTGLDTATIIKATHALSSEMNLSKLLSQLMTIVMENAGATSGALILKSHDGLFIEACSWDKNARIDVNGGGNVGVCAKIVNSVLLTRNTATISNAQKDVTLKNDSHIQGNKVLSLFCTPISHKSVTLGVLYLENNKIEGVFHQNRTSIINHLLSSVSANVENARMVKNIMELNESYERFLPRQFLQLLNKGDVRNIINGDNVTHLCSVSFLDIRNFTGITETLSSEGSMKFVNQFLEYICPEIEKHGGFIDKFIGDAVMSLYPNEAQNALYGVTGMIHALEKLNEDHYTNKDPLKIGIGLHYGVLQLGTVGYANRMDGTAIGDVVNTASRLESLTKGFGVNIIISQEYLDKAVEEAGSSDFGSIKFCKLGDFILKGRTVPSSLYEVYDSTWKETGSPREELPYILELFTSRRFQECETHCRELVSKYPENHNILDFYAETSAMFNLYEIGEDWDKAICLTKDGTAKPLEGKLKESAGPQTTLTLSKSDREDLERYRRIFGKLNKTKAANYCIQWNPTKKRYEKVDLNASIDVQKSE